MNSRKYALILTVSSLATSFQASASLSTFNASGANAGDILPIVDAFRTELGGSLNPNIPGSLGSGRREINWDAVPQTASAPNDFPAGFFNGNVPGRARGVVFATPGTGFQVSANAGDGPVQFENINPGYPQLFEPFSAQKLFTPLGSTITDVSFFVPGSSQPATTHGFGAVFSDVDVAGSTSLQFFDINGNLLDSVLAPAASGDETFSFAGVVFSEAVVAKVRITAGSEALSAATSTADVVVMDDFIFGEPQRVPENSNTFTSLSAAVLGLLVCAPTIRRGLRHSR